MMLKLKQIFAIAIACMTLNGLVYGMDAKIDDDTLNDFFHAIQIFDIKQVKEMVNQYPTIVDAIKPGTEDSYALDYVTYFSNFISKNRINVLEELLQCGCKVNIPGKDYLYQVLKRYNPNSDDHDFRKQMINLLCSAGASLDSGDARPYKECFGEDILLLADTIGYDQIINCIKAHINTRLSEAIMNDNQNEVRRLVTKYNIDINQALPAYGIMQMNERYFQPISKDPMPISFIPLHEAIKHNKNDMACFLVNDLQADVTIKNKLGRNALHLAPDQEVARLLLSKNNNLTNMTDINGVKPIGDINKLLTPEALHELRNQPEIIANLRALKNIYEGKPAGGNPGGDNPNVFTNGSSLWKLVGGGVALAIVVVAAKKLYNWWYKTAEAEEEKAENQEQENAEQKSKEQQDQEQEGRTVQS